VEGGADAELKAREHHREEQERKRVEDARVYRAWRDEQLEIRRREIAEGIRRPHEMEADARREREVVEAREAWDADLAEVRELENLRDGAVAPPEVKLEQGHEKSDEIEVYEVEDKADEVSELLNGSVVEKIEEDSGVSDGSSVKGMPEQILDLTPPLPPASLSPEDENRGDAAMTTLLARARAAEAVDIATREALVAESVQQYRRQKQEAVAARDPQQATDAPPSFVVDSRALTHSTWNVALREETAVRPTAPPRLEWTVAMDMHLTAMVRDYKFDFDRIFLKMISAACDGDFEEELPKAHYGLISSDACRLRWCELDASNWSELAPGVTSQDALPVYRINVDPSEVSDGKGGQLSFDQLMVKVNSVGGLPRYLTPPAQLPSMKDLVDEESDEDDDNDEEEFAQLRQQLKKKSYLQ
jgi:hypothetical protein